MDYDENDFQSQNFHHLIGDDKFSANFRSFALPKFDLDEHLRFDGLVEEEVLLGIQGQENNWIDFTPGNSAIEFSSSAVESCSIARHKNVWSEATSSESVDLLLKSVGDDQMVNNKTVMMEASADDESHGNDNRVDIYLDKNDDHKTYMMSTVPVDPKLTQDEIQGNLLGSNGGHLEILHDVHGLSQATDGGISRIGMYMDHSNGRFSSDGEIGDNVTSIYNAIQKLKADDDGLCDAVLNKEVIHEVLKRTEAPSVSVSDSSVLNSLSLESNKDVELVIENEKLNTGVFSGEQHQRCISNSSGFLSDEALDENSFVMYSDDKENQHFVSKTDALAPLNRKSIYSEFPEKSDGLVVDIPYENKYLNGNNDMCENFFVKEEWMSRVALVQEEKIENNNVFVSSKSVLKIAPLTEGYQSVGDKLSFVSVGDDDGLDGKRIQLIMNSTTSSDDIEVENDDIEKKNDKCIDDIDVKLDPVHQLLENKYTDVDNTQMLTESQTSIHIHNEAQGTKNEDCGRMSVNSPSFICEKSGLVVEGNHMDADRPELKLDESKATPDESSFPVALTDISSLPVAVVDSEHITSPSTCCKSSASSASISVDLTDGLISKVHGSVDKESSPSYTNPDRIISGTVSKTIEKVQDLPPTIQMISEELPLNITANKLVEEELGSVLSSPAFQKSSFHLSASEETTTSDLALENKEPLIQILSESDIQEDTKDLKVSCTTSLLSTAILASVSCPSKIKDTSSEKVFQYDSGTQLTFSVQSQDSELSKDTAGLNLPIEQKGSPSCLAMPVPDSFSKGNELKLSGASLLSNSEKNVVKETSNGEASSSDCVDDTIVREHVSNIVMQPPSPVRSIDFTQPQNDSSSSSSGNTIGDGKTLQLKGNASCHYPREEKDDILNSLGVVSHVTSEASVAVVADDLIGHMKYPSHVCTGITAESNSSEANSRNSSSSEPNYSSPIVMTFRGCQPNNSDHPELKTSNNLSSVSSNKDVITGDVDGNSNGLRGTSAEDGDLIFGVSTSKGLTEKGNCTELSLPNLKMPKKNSQGFPVEVKAFDCSTEGKPKNASRTSNEKKISSKGKIKKEARALKQSSVMDAKCSISTYKSVGNSGKDKPLVEMQGKTPIDCSTTKTSPSLDAQTSSIPDLNSSSSLALSYHHFTDLQQVQLRAQIFVYGALISGMPPDEAYMVSAFGGTDGGRKLWHGVWHGSIEKFQNQKSPLGYDTPHSRPAIWIPEHVSTGNDVQSKVPTPKSSNIIISSSVPSSTVSFPSPLWSLSYGNDGHGHHTGISRGSYMNFSQTPSPLARQSFVSRQHVGANSSWLSQSPRPAPWFFSSQISALDGNAQHSTVPVNETAHVAPIRDSCGPFAPTVEVAPHRVLMHAPDAAATTTAAVLQMETTKGAATSVNNKNTPTTQKVRKRKKSMTAEELSLPTSQILAESVSTPSAFKSPSLPSASMLLSSNSQLNVFHSPASISASHNISPSHRQTICGNNNQQISILHDESCSKLDQAKLQAEEAAAFAASTVKYSQSIWSQLAAQKNSGMVIQIEEKLASAAAAAAAAASVAKAAAAAANVAAAAALQAKLMADEAMNAITAFNPDSDIYDVGKRLTGIPPVSILKGMDMIHGSGAIISAASEAARKRVESASAATKRAENLDAVVKAAKLAAEAVTQAGTVIAMGDPLPFTLRELVDAGSEGFWRGHDGTSVKHSKPSDMHGEEYTGLDKVKVCGGSSKKMDDRHSNDKETQKAAGAGELLSLNECHQQFQRSSEGDFSSVGPETNHHVNLSSIQKDSVVEVMSNEDGLKGAWFSARVVDINDNKAYVCYSDISTTEGKLQEWIILDNGEKAPRIRIAHSITSVRFEGTRKRQRANLGSYIWEVGDHVDTWIHDRWWEGTITEKDPGDEMKLIVQFTARGDKHVVNSWSLRPSLIWKDGQWMEWSHANGKSPKPHEGDTPQVKRQRLASLEQQITSDFDADGTNKLSKNIIIEESRKPDASRPLLLSAKDRTFSIGNNSSKQVTSDTFKQKRTGLQKEGSRVFGVPRPGKKRKFMEVSKHYVANKSDKIGEGSNDSIKFAKYLMPQVSRQSRNTSKVDSKGKKAIQVKPRGTVKAVNSQSFQLGSVDDKEKSSLSASNEESPHGNHKDVISSFKGNTNYSDKMTSFKFSSLPNQVEKKKTSTVRSEHYMQPTPASLSKKKSTPDSQTNLPVKQTSSVDRTSSVEDKVHGNPGKIHEVMEPRRSNRRIQPTSRLLEGLQSSLVITKIGSVSHDRKPPRGGSSSRGNSHG